MTNHSYSSKILGAILSVLMAAQVFPFGVMADSVVIDSGVGIDPFPDYVPDVVYDDDDVISPEIPPDFTYLNESEYELIQFPETDESEESGTDSESDSSGAAENPADFNAQPFIKNKKYLSETSEETVSILGGSLEYSNTDFVLQGINGLDLVIGRRYKSVSAYEHSAETEYFGQWSTIKLIKEDYEKRLYDIGKGWSFNFPSIRIGGENESDTLYLDDGMTYSIHIKNGGTLELVSHYTSDFVLEYSDKYSNGFVSSKWVLKYKDGIQKFFSEDGKLIGIQNRYGNTINFVNSSRDEHPYIEITDTLGRLTVISGEDIDGGHIMKVNLPGDIELSYVVKDTDKSYGALTEYHDPEENVIDYSYKICNATVTLTGLPPQYKTTSICLLSTITFPDGLQTSYSYYGVHTNTLSPTIFRVESRKDTIGSKIYNKEDYDFGETKEIWNYGNVAVTDSDGIKRVYSFDLKHRIDEIKSYYNDKVIKDETIYYSNPPGATVYNREDFLHPKILPTYISTKTYRGSDCKQSVVMYIYDDKNNMTAEWSEYADGDNTNTENKTIYIYDDEYSLLTSRTYKTDENT